jgi:hypothetical protein
MHHQEMSYDAWIGHDAYDSAGEKIGAITDVFYDDRTGRPEWLTVKTGMFKGDTFVPLHGSQVHQDNDGGDEGGSLRLAFDKEMIKGAPRIDTDGHMTPAEEQELWTYYGYDYQADPKLKTHGYGPAYTKNRADQDFKFEMPQGQTRVEDRGSVEAEATIHNQEARVVEGTEKVRLRKYQRTEMVPVTKEEVRVERVSDDDTTQVEERTSR